MQVGGVPKPMIIMGGGYDPCEDADPASDSCKSSGKGKGIYLIDAIRTEPWSRVFATDRPVIGDVAVVTDDVTGLAQWIYAADLGGNVYRISAAATGPTSLPIGVGRSDRLGNHEDRLARLLESRRTTARRTASSCSGRAWSRRTVRIYLMLGSGDREKPLDDTYWPNSYAVENYFFMIKDKPVDPDWLESEDGAPAAARRSSARTRCWR